MLENLYAGLDALATTLDMIEIKGSDNVSRMLGCMEAIDSMKYMVVEAIKSEKERVETEDGRSGDIGTESGTNSK